MNLPERFSNLPEYAFPRLRNLLDAHKPGAAPINMTIGEPKHDFPDFVTKIITEHAAGFGVYPPNDGTAELLAAISGWIKRRYDVDLATDQIMALNGTREGLFNALVALCPEAKSAKRPVVLIPNPFYQVYAVAALAIGADPVYVPATAATGYLPDYNALSDDILNRTAIAFLCSPSNPQGAVASRDYWENILDLAEKYDFRVFADECYSEIYRDTPPIGALEVAKHASADPERVFVFNSLSKRSNLPGLRSGFVAGGAQGVKEIRKLRAYAGAPLPLPLQRVAEKVWADETHVEENRALYAEKYHAADTVFESIQGYLPPSAGFFLWLPVEDGEEAALKLWRETGVRVVPGGYFGREVNGHNPGQGYIRVAMVAPKQEMQRGLEHLRDCLMR